jgi:holo-[acyl-carrier protein] synthase
MSSPEHAATIASSVHRLADAVLSDGSVGVDAVHIPTWARHLELGGEPLVNRIYTTAEVEFCANRPERLAARLAAKEAVLKTLGTGIRGIALRDVEIRSETSGQPVVVLHGAGSARAAELGLTGVAVSLCHEEEFALAVAGGIRRSPS